MADRFNVIVVGAGLAGLIAARDVREAGLTVRVVEARERVGGRTWTQFFDDAGRAVDLGAEWVAPHHHAAFLRELDRYGISVENAAESAAGPPTRN